MISTVLDSNGFIYYANTLIHINPSWNKFYALTPSNIISSSYSNN